MKGFRLNEDKAHVDKIIAAMEKKNGHCPCRITADETTLCPCDDFIDSGVCRCNLFVPKGQEN